MKNHWAWASVICTFYVCFALSGNFFITSKHGHTGNFTTLNICLDLYICCVCSLYFEGLPRVFRLIIINWRNIPPTKPYLFCHSPFLAFSQVKKIAKTLYVFVQLQPALRNKARVLARSHVCLSFWARFWKRCHSVYLRIFISSIFRRDQVSL